MPASDLYTTGLRIYLDITKLQRLGDNLSGSAQEGSDPGKQLVREIGFRNDVVRSAIKDADPSLRCAFIQDNQNPCPRSFLQDEADHLEMNTR